MRRPEGGRQRHVRAQGGTHKLKSISLFIVKIVRATKMSDVMPSASITMSCMPAAA